MIRRRAWQLVVILRHLRFDGVIVVVGDASVAIVPSLAGGRAGGAWRVRMQVPVRMRVVPDVASSWLMGEHTCRHL